MLTPLVDGFGDMGSGGVVLVFLFCVFCFLDFSSSVHAERFSDLFSFSNCVNSDTKLSSVMALPLGFGLVAKGNFF